MTKRLYYEDSYTYEFTATIIEQLTIDGKPAVILDQTYFYPTGGGQPNDTGTINNAQVIDVQTRKEDYAVIHVLDRLIDVGEVTCSVDWARRFDHMQQHTGQHILTQAFVQVAEAQTVGFHLSAETVTIDLDRIDISPEQFALVEDLANAVIYKNLEVLARYIKPEDTDGVRIRRIPDALVTDGLRVIDIGGFDVTACGGTHVSRTGAIGMIKMNKIERRGDKLRIEFKCGGRALMDYRIRNEVLNTLTPELNCGFWEVDSAVLRLIEQFKVSQRKLKQAQTRLVEFDAQILFEATEPHNGVRTIKIVVEYELEQARLLAKILTAQPGVLALIGVLGTPSHLILARSADLPYDMNEGLQRAFNVLGQGRGGGKSDFVQGGGIDATQEDLARALDAAGHAILWL